VRTVRSMIYLDTSVVPGLLTSGGAQPHAPTGWRSAREPLIQQRLADHQNPNSALWIRQRHHGLSPQARQAAGTQFSSAAAGRV